MTDLYDTDTFAWSEQQAALLRRVAAGERLNVAPDWPNIAEEIETLGKNQARELASRIAVILEHLIKLEASPSSDPRPSWRATIRRQRAEIDRLLADAPSLRARVGLLIAAELAAASLTDNRETPTRDIATVTYTEAQILGDWLP
jgi:hypothetical protein